MVMSDIVRFWFRPRQATANELAARVVAAGHKSVVVRDGLVGLVPFELRADGFKWAENMEDHFRADFVRSE